MGHVSRTPAKTWRANWRDPTGRQRAKNFRTKREAAAFLAQVDVDLRLGAYVDPAAGKRPFAEQAERWLAGRNDELTTTARNESLMRNHLIAKWGAWPIGTVGHQDVQQWVTDLGKTLSRATVVECLRLLSAVMKSAVRSRLIAFNPCEGVRAPRRRTEATADRTITRDQLVKALLPAIPDAYRPLVATAGLSGLRWGECVGLRWGRVDLDRAELHVVETLVEVAGKITAKPFPKSKAGRRTVPIPAALVTILAEHRTRSPRTGKTDLVFTNGAGGPVGRTSFRSRVWKPSLVRAGLLGQIHEAGPDTFVATWTDDDHVEWSAEFTTHRDAVAHVARKASGGLRFHDLRHSYATWLVSDGVPVNIVQAVLGHQQASTTLDRYTHAPKD